MSEQLVLDRRMAQQMVRMFDELYRQGVKDCIDVADEGRCREFLEATTQPGVYGLLGDEFYISPKEWQLRLQVIAGRISLNSPMYRLFCRMGNYTANYLGCFLPLACDFYRKGISDALKYEHKLDVAVFRNKMRVWLTEKGVKSVSSDGYKSEIQQMCFNRKRSEQSFMDGYRDLRQTKYEHIGEHDARKRVRNPKHWDVFVERIGVLSRKPW